MDSTLAVRQILAPMVLGISLGFAYLGITRGLSRASAINRRNIVASFLEAVALKILLPSFVIEALLKTEAGGDLLGAFSVGFLMPPASLLAVSIYNRLTAHSMLRLSSYAAFRFLTSTFGGGNRGTIFLILLFGQTDSFPEYIKYFTALDFGNFLCLLLVVRFLIRKTFGTAPAAPRSLLGNYALAVLLIVASYFLLERIGLVEHGQMRAWLSSNSGLRKTLLTVLLFCAIVLRIRISPSLMSRFWSDAIGFLIVRSVVIGVVVCAGKAFSLPQPFMLSAVVLLCMPPSSLMPSFLSDTVAQRSSIEYINTMTVAYNLIYLLVLFGGVLVLVAR